MLRNINVILSRYGAVFAEGLWNTLWLSAVSVLLGSLLGVCVALGRMSASRFVNGVAGAYVELVRGTPLLLQLYFFWLALPKLLPEMPDALCVLCALVFNAGAYVGEIVRAGVQAVDAGQHEAALSLGMEKRAVMTRIIFPQALRNILPALVNEMIVMIKETSLASTFFVGELMTAYRKVQSATFLALEPLAVSGAIYLALTVGLSRLARRLERRLKNDER